MSSNVFLLCRYDGKKHGAPCSGVINFVLPESYTIPPRNREHVHDIESLALVLVVEKKLMEVGKTTLLSWKNMREL